MFSRKPARRQNRKKRPMLKRIVVTSIVLIFTAGMLYSIWYVTRLPSVSITDVSVSGTETISDAEVRGAIDRVLSGAYLGLVSRRFVYLYPEDRVADAVRSIPRVGESTVLREGNTLRVSIVERVPELLWCDIESPSLCYFVDQGGVAYEKAPPLEGSALLRVVTSIKPEAGATLLDRDLRNLLMGFAYTLEEQQLFRVFRIDYDQASDATYHLAGGGRILISTLHDFNTTYENLASLLASVEFKHLQSGDFEYIDLRFGYKVFVQEEAPAMPTASSTDELPVD